MPFDMELEEVDTGMAYLNDFLGNLREGIGRSLASPVTQGISEDLEIGHLEGPLLLADSPPTRHLSVPPANSEGTVCMADVHPLPPAMPEFDLEPVGTEAEDIDVHVSDVDQHVVNRTTRNDVMVARLTPAECYNVPASESNQCRRSVRLTLKSTAPIKYLNKGLSRTRIRGATKGKANAKRGHRPKCPNGCQRTFSRTRDAHRHPNETMQCRGGGERKSYLCPECQRVFTRSDALLRHRSRRDGKPPACKGMST